MKLTRIFAAAATLALATSLSGCGVADIVKNLITGGEVDVFSLKAGDCLMVIDTDSGPVSTSPKVPCSEPHEDEVFKVVDATLTEFPGENEIYDHADELCIPHFEDYVGIDYWDSEFFIWSYTPTADGWAGGDREIVCVLSTTDELLVGSMKGSGR